MANRNSCNNISFSSCDGDEQNNPSPSAVPSPIIEIEEDQPCNESVSEEIDVINEVSVHSNESIEIGNVSDDIPDDEVANMHISEKSMSVHPSTIPEVVMEDNVDDGIH